MRRRSSQAAPSRSRWSSTTTTTSARAWPRSSRREGFETRLAGSLEEARKSIADAAPDLVLVDLQLPDGHGLELLDETHPASDTEFVVVTGNASVETAVHAMRDGALDYLTKPFEPAKLTGVLANVARTRGLKRELSGLRWQLRRLGRFGKLVGSSPPMQEVYNLIARVAPTTATVLIVGESGTGKELVAETLHELSRRKDKPLFAVNCGAVSPNLIESELFGHEKGSFTGADRRHIGYFERAAGGTLLLDEITEMNPELQVKLLRVLESGRFLRVGGNDPIEADVRILAATNRDPTEAVASGALREDLYYRLNVFAINLPPLRERGEDIAAARAALPRRAERERGDAEALDAAGAARARGAPVARQRARAAQRRAPGVHPRRPRDRRRLDPHVRGAGRATASPSRPPTARRSRCRSAARSRRSRSS